MGMPMGGSWKRRNGLEATHLHIRCRFYSNLHGHGGETGKKGRRAFRVLFCCPDPGFFAPLAGRGRSIPAGLFPPPGGDASGGLLSVAHRKYGPPGGPCPFRKRVFPPAGGRKDVSPTGDFLIAQKVTKDAHRNPWFLCISFSRSDGSTGKDSSAQQTCIVSAPCFAAALALSNRLLLLCSCASEGANLGWPVSPTAAGAEARVGC